MASQKQIDANRRNAKKSTGPNTDEGKSRSRRNALRDGITGQVITLSDDDRAIFEKIKSEHIDDFKVEGIDELKLANTIVWDTWPLDQAPGRRNESLRIRRARRRHLPGRVETPGPNEPLPTSSASPGPSTRTAKPSTNSRTSANANIATIRPR